MQQIEFSCEMELTAYLIGGKWKISILWGLRDGPQRFGEIRRRLGAVTQKMLTQQLRELEECSLIKRTVYAEVPPRVEYALTEDAAALLPVLEQMCRWGKAYYLKHNQILAPE